MARAFDSIPDHVLDWIAEQPVFFVASAPLAADGHVNVSPKGGDCFRVLSPHEVAYADYTGSGAETIAHTRENGRLTVMFCSFGPKPLIFRLYGRAASVLPGDERWDELVGLFPPNPGTRAVITLAVDRTSTACGYTVPRMELLAPRSTLDDWAARRSDDDLAAYRVEKNATSIDGLPALDPVG